MRMGMGWWIRPAGLIAISGISAGRRCCWGDALARTQTVQVSSSIPQLPFYRQLRELRQPRQPDHDSPGLSDSPRYISRQKLTPVSSPSILSLPFCTVSYFFSTMATKTLEARFEHLSVKEEKETPVNCGYGKQKVRWQQITSLSKQPSDSMRLGVSSYRLFSVRSGRESEQSEPRPFAQAGSAKYQ